uniref:Uncharacterized protein n=1 Tax=Junco hyemalis TaxID=40217 RepID=A0A8C5JVS5_JUNHY
MLCQLWGRACAVPAQTGPSFRLALEFGKSGVGTGVWEGSGAGTGVGEGSGVATGVGEGSGAGTVVWEGSGVGTEFGEGSGVGTGVWEGSGVGTGFGEGSGAGTGAGCARDGWGRSLCSSRGVWEKQRHLGINKLPRVL